jgi:hypothetical protein
MSRYVGNSDTCPHCGLRYARFRTGMSYQDVFIMYWTESEDSSDWRYKKRNTVLGKWHQIKQEMWKYHINQCEQLKKYEQLKVQHWEEKGYPPEWDENFGEELL